MQDPKKYWDNMVCAEKWAKLAETTTDTYRVFCLQMSAKYALRASRSL